MFVLTLQVEALLPASQSLKDKRQVVRSVLDTARRRFSVAAAEVAHQDLWQRTELGFATVSGSASHASEVMDDIERMLWSQAGLELVRAERTWLDAD